MNDDELRNTLLALTSSLRNIETMLYTALYADDDKTTTEEDNATDSTEEPSTPKVKERA